MSNLYLDESLSANDLAVGASVALTGDEARHAATVSRLRSGESVLLGNGSGVQATCEVTGVENKRVDLTVVSVAQHPLEEFRLVLVQALAKGDRDERAVQAAVEVGVDAVLPWQAERSVSRWSGDKIEKGVVRWQKVVREATKQSLRAWTPDVLPPESTASLLTHTGHDRVLILEPTAKKRLSDLTRAEIEPVDPRGSVLVLVGPEGGVSEKELSVLTEAGALPVRLGESVLRTSTAGPVALALINVALGRW
ncbi:16S rRNA (uracil(1498)-N(3))-methyltransferase [Lysinibacter cavernae]|uniref:Ribosomal RNA small subunit methyltransferase E n=1 Tax=Lysinibacter cavernae TaxID=1640652 RepID=A0A7X5TT01_9MICO|nr:16S rRNA (uracil(1498)-N(3))-methyltransferase [Lysinibacter cavernae]NIH53004.1 16S rRNA (uracil1498-N3)-methyltransferase [Lysinibacter cavernae]